jgi:hypothetical protein
LLVSDRYKQFYDPDWREVGPFATHLFTVHALGMTTFLKRVLFTIEARKKAPGTLGAAAADNDLRNDSY